ncbi:rhodanese-like domain-containing protein [Anaeromyxobacter terrae]|uniref:rhodanese-like domain-containing protein n=1 Tax=Anaeromyxobacter terrae TaxID=2925406 RepID=UPI001F5A02C9|nr:rhodanese-like domain-containing protein [Anaeromyxobacter sp. SG22]
MDGWTWAVVAAVGLAFLVARRLLVRRAPAEVVLQQIKAGAKIVDVRTPGEFAGGAYPGAVNIPLQALRGRLREIPRDRPVVLYCASGMRSASAARILEQAGYAQVVNAGGLHQLPT